VLTNFDTVAAAGAGFKAVDKLFSTTVSNGQMLIQLIPVVSNPNINAIEITASAAPASLTAADTAPADAISSPVVATPSAGITGQPVSFAFAGSGSDNVTYNWTFGDGAVSSDPAPSHAFTAPGDYQVSVTAIDANGATASGSLTFTVSADQRIDLGTVTLHQNIALSLKRAGLSVSAQATRFKAGTLPPKLRISGGKLVGKAETAGDFTFDIHVQVKTTVSTAKHSKVHWNDTVQEYRLVIAP
jgi:PKD repeat protein